MELRHLRYFVTVAEHENFHRAAETLHVSQPPLSRQMRDLQAEMGVELFEPAGRGVRLTAAGRRFAERARDVLADVDAAAEEARLTARGRIGTVAIGFETGTAYFGRLSSIVSAFRRREPRVTVDLTPMSSAEQWDALRSGRIALGYGYYAPDDPSLEHIVVSRDRLGLVVPHDHRLAARAQVGVVDLRDEPVLLQPRILYPRLHDDIVAAVRAHGITLNVTAEIVDLEALLTLVASGDAVTFLPEKQHRILLLGSAVWRPIVDLGVQVSDVLMWRRADADAPLVRPLIDLARPTPAADERGRTTRGRRQADGSSGAG